MTRIPTALFVLIVSGLTAGCTAKSGIERAAVEGAVTLDGKPIEQGSITFVPTGGSTGMTAGGEIKNGRYKIEAERGPVVGSNKVKISASRKTGRQVQAPMSDPGTMTDEIVEAVPAKYNTQTTLIREFKSGPNTVDFAVESN